MRWTGQMTRDTAFLADIIQNWFHPQEVSLMSFTLQLSSFTRKQLYRRLQQAYASGSLKLVKRIHALLALAQGQSVSEVADMLSLGEQTVRDYRNQFSAQGHGQLGLQIPSRAAQQTHQNPTPTARRVDQSESTRLWLYLRMLEYTDDSGPHLAPIWGSIPSPLSLYLAQEYGLFLPESPFCLGSSQ